jgi:chromate transporter
VSSRDPDALLALFLHFSLLTAVSFGGLNSVLPEMQRYVVEVNGWLTAKQFGDIFALGQAAPAPNVMFVTTLGWMIAAWPGAIALTLALVLPSGTLTSLMIVLNARNPDAKIGRAVRRGLSPVTIGLVLASGWVLVSTVNEDWRGYAVTAVALALLLTTRVHPLWLIAAGALAGIAGLV